MGPALEVLSERPVAVILEQETTQWTMGWRTSLEQLRILEIQRRWGSSRSGRDDRALNLVTQQTLADKPTQFHANNKLVQEFFGCRCCV